MQRRTITRTKYARFQPAIAALVALAALAPSCAVDQSNVDQALAMYVGTPADSPLVLDNKPVEDPAPTPAESLYELNDQGQQLFPRVIEGDFDFDDCDFMTWTDLPVEPECGWLERPLHGNRNIDIELPVLIFRATGDGPAADPLIYLHGGPSDGILQHFGFGSSVYDVVVEPFVEDRDVIVFDQRGTGLAKPDLGCNHSYEWYSAHDEDPDTFVPRTARTCAANMQVNRIRLEQFSRQSSADDVMVLARELGYESFNLHGSSWGGILGYTVIQMHPEWVRSAILNSPLSPATDLTGSMPSSFQESMNAVQANCERSAACVARHGDIVERYIKVFAQLDEEPLDMRIGGFYDVTLTADELSYLLFGLLYAPEAIAKIPDLLLDLENGDIRLAEQLAWDYGWGWGIDFTFLTYMCTDIVPTSSKEQVEAQQIGIDAFDRVDDAPDGRGETAEALCARMEVGQAPIPTMREVVPTTPTMVFSGSMDPITPFSSGEEIVADLPNATFVGFTDLAHGVTDDPCANGIARAFLADPEADHDLTCALPENRPLFEFENVAFTR